MVDPLKVLVTGTSGLLGEDVLKVFKESGHDVIEVKGRGHLDLTRADETLELIRRHKPQVVVHSAGSQNDY
ncbi:MAG: NAD-dependent epimerase/dehydratase family protein [Candidatus Methanomethylicaceae archaeon]